MKGVLVAKVGGSLFDLTDLRQRLQRWLGTVCDRRVLLVPGGGASADVIRRLDATHQLGEEQAHWLALRTLTTHAYFLSALLNVPVRESPDAAPFECALLDAYAYCRHNDVAPHSWRVTSDSIAAHVAVDTGGHLALLKSADWPAGLSWPDAAVNGLVDAAFPDIVASTGLAVTWINLRR